jgi:FkbM family methyltransferase
MKKLLTKIIGENLISYFKIIKRKYFSGQKNKRNEDEDLIKRINFYSLFISKGELCFDIGANEGNRIEPLLQIGARVVALEPQKSCYYLLRHTFGKKIELIRKGVGEKEEVKDFFISESNFLSSFSQEWINKVKESRFKEAIWNRIEKVEMTTLDRLIKKFGIPSFIKIDVEGYELNVLKGLSIPIKNISFEYTVPENLDRLINCLDQIILINPNATFNYSISETMELVLPMGISGEEIKKLVQTEDFIKTNFGDIYVKSK